MGLYSFVVSLRTHSYDVDPDEICQRLGMQPKIMWRLGEPKAIIGGMSSQETYDRNFCSFKIKALESESLEEFLQRMTKILTTHKNLFSKIKKGKGRVEYFVDWRINLNSGVVLSSALMKNMSNLGIDLTLDVCSEIEDHSDNNTIFRS